MTRVVKTRIEVEGVWLDQEVVLDGDDPLPFPTGVPLAHVGRPVPRTDGLERVSGRARYTHDVALKDMLYCRILRAPHAHARLVSLDVSRAAARPGVLAVLCRDNAPAMPWYGERSRLFDDHIRYAGEEVAAVAAIDDDLAAEALLAIDARYEIAPPVLDPEAALAPGAPKLHPGGNRAGTPEEYRRGDPEAAFRAAEVTVELEVRTAAALHNALETHGSVASWSGGKLTVWDSTQNLHGIRQALAQRLGLDLSAVRVRHDFMGGGFGAKNGLRKYTVIAALLSRMTGRPVKAMLSREEENLAAGNRAPVVARVRLGAGRDGRLTAIHFTSVSAVGAYGQGSMPVCGPAKTLYAVANVLTREEAANTSIGSHAAFRAPGYVEGTTALESAMDELARKVGLDPIEIRRRNRAERDPVSGLPYSGNALDQCLERAAELLGPRPAAATGPRRLGIGIACGLWGAGGGPPAHALVKLNRDGSAVVLTGTQDIGTGTRTVLAQIAAEELGLPIAAVEVRLGDTEVGLHAPFSAGSMTLASMGPAVRLAAVDARAKLLAVVSARTGIAADAIALVNRHVVVRGGPGAGGPGEPLAQVLDGIEEFTLTGHGSRHPNPEMVIKSFAAHAALVEVDVETGETRVIHYAAVHDIGRVVNPMTATSQVAGGILMGIGFSLMEERVVDPRTGRVLNPNLADYRVMTSADVPRLSIAFIDRPDESANNLGARGLGEPPIIPVAATIANAVRDAIGVRPTTFPLTPGRILAALGKAPAAGSETSIRLPRPRSRPRRRSRSPR